MESIIKKIKFKTRNWFVVAPLIAFVILLLGSAFIAFMYWISGESVSENFAETTRNFAWLFLMWLSPTGVIIGLWLTWWRMRLAQESHDRERLENLQERFKRAADMLNSNIEWERVGACLVLADLGKADESMKRRCVRLLFAFINAPPLNDDEKDRPFKELFPTGMFLRSDIQEAIVSFSAIYELYSNSGIDDEAVRLPPYFWWNENKGKISFIRANLQGESLYKAELSRANLRRVNLAGAYLASANLRFADLQRAKLSSSTLIEAKLHRANLRGANLKEADLQRAKLPSASLVEAKLHNANLRGANLKEANLLFADISNADMRGVKWLEKEQILSAKWGYDKDGGGGPPTLSKKMEQDKKVEKWLKKPAYGKKINSLRGGTK